jgi:hypothetical protein
MAIATKAHSGGVIAALNGKHHRVALYLFMVIVLVHWAEHLVQAYQIWLLGWPVKEARGMLGMPFPSLVTSELLHYGFALVMLVGLWVLRPGFAGQARAWWTVALAIQFWHHIEHLLLLIQAQTGTFYFGGSVPTSVLQTVIARVELHLFYNSIVFIPMVIAMIYHLRPNRRDLAAVTCDCGLDKAARAASRPPVPVA